MSKILTTIIYRIIEQTIESSFDEDQFGSREKIRIKEELL